MECKNISRVCRLLIVLVSSLLFFILSMEEYLAFQTGNPLTTEVMSTCTQPILIYNKSGLNMKVPDNTTDLLQNIVETIGLAFVTLTLCYPYIYSDV